MLQLTQKELIFEPDKKVIKATEYAAYVDALTIIEEAKNRASMIVEDAKNIYESEKKRGYEDGMQAGKEEISRSMLDFAAKSVENFAKLEEDVVKLVTQALRRIIGEIDDKTLIINVVKNALKVVRNQKQVAIKLSPGQVADVRDKLASILGDSGGVNYVDIAADPRLPDGSCIIETEIGVVDASVEVQLAAIEKSMFKAIKIS